MKFRIFLLIIW